MEFPFRYGIIVDEPFFIDREDEQKDIYQWLSTKQSIVLYSPRRYGKSSLVIKLLNQFKKKGYNTIYIDFFRVHSKEKFVEIFYQEILNTLQPWEKAIKQINQFVKKIKPVITFGDDGNPLISIQSSESVSDISEVFDLPQKLAKNKPWIVVFDEFQDIAKLNGDSFEKELRASLIHHDNVGYVFMGSQSNMLLNMFTHPNKAFYQFAKIMELKKISHDIMAQYVFDQFNKAEFKIKLDDAQSIVNIADNIPHYVQYLASAVWETAFEKRQVNPKTIITAVSKILNNQLDYFTSLYQGLTPNQQKVLLALVVESENIFTENYKKKYNLSAVSTTQRAIERLIYLAIIEKVSGFYHFSDPFFKEWLKSI